MLMKMVIFWFPKQNMVKFYFLNLMEVDLTLWPMKVYAKTCFILDG